MMAEIIWLIFLVVLLVELIEYIISITAVLVVQQPAHFFINLNKWLFEKICNSGNPAALHCSAVASYWRAFQIFKNNKSFSLNASFLLIVMVPSLLGPKRRTFRITFPQIDRP